MDNKRAAWPNGKRLAVSVTIMFETWRDDSAPNYSVQTTSLKKGTVDHAARAWSTYGGRVGVWRLIRLLDRHGIPGTFFVNGRCAELYPEPVKQIVRSGHDAEAHSYTHDDVLAYMSVEEQQATIRRSIDLVQDCTGKTITGWASPVVAFTPETAGLLVKEGLTWHNDVTYVDLPIREHTPYGDIAGVPTTDFSDNRVLRANTADLFDVHKNTFEYLLENEPMAMMTLVLHCQFGGRPLVAAVVDRLFQHMKSSNEVWFAKHSELGRWALEQEEDERTHASRFFAGAKSSVAAE